MKIKKVFNLDEMKGTIYFMSDLHYNHENILRLSGRNKDFKDISEMNDYILSELKEKLTEDDIIFDLGDMVWKSSADSLIKILDSTPAKIYKLWGNHDNFNLFSTKEVKEKFELLTDYLDIQVRREDTDFSISLFHYPIEDYNHMFRGGLHLFGHVHGNLDEKYSTGKDPRLMVDVGFDSALAKKAGSFLISIDNILDWFYEKTGGEKFNVWASKNYGYDK